MDKALGKLVMLLFVLGFGVFYGVSISKDGIEQVHGPIDPQQIEQAADAGTAEAETQPELMKPSSQPQKTDHDLRSLRPVSDSLLGKLFDKVGSLLNYLADHLIRFLVRLGEAVLS